MLKLIIAACLVSAICASESYGDEQAPPAYNNVHGAFPAYGGYPYGAYPYSAYQGAYQGAYGGFPYGGFPYYGYPGAFPYHGYNYGAAPFLHAPAAPVHPGFQGYLYIGQFEGSCHGAANGLYYVDDRSFAFCSNGIKTIQNCAEGSENPEIGYFRAGHPHYGDFCSVNLSASAQ